MIDKIGITERGDPALDHSWTKWVKEGNPAILITKNCITLEKMLDEMLFPNVIVHCTITGWGGTSIEPNVPKPEDTLKSYKSLSEKLGPNRVVLRIDPIIPSTIGLEKAVYVNSHKLGRVRISFLDAYEHTKMKFKELGMFIHDEFHAPLDIRKGIWEMLECPEVCAEPGLPCSGCLSALDCVVLGVQPSKSLCGQRPLCLCVANKFELLTEKKPCPHGCVYCYWKGK